jgi:hypothetical protein
MARQRHDNDQFLAFALANSDDPTYLGSADVVRDLIRTYLSEWSNFTDTDPDSDQIEAYLAKETPPVVDVLLGKNPDYKSLPGWNEPGKIDVFIAKSALFSGDTPEDVLTAYLYGLVTSYQEIVNLENDGIPPTELKPHILEMLETAQNELLGWAEIPDDEEE